MTQKTFSESFSKTFSKRVRTAMHLKWPSYLILLENLYIFEPETGRESPDSDPRLQVLLRVQQGVTPGGMATVSETVSKPASQSQFAGTVQHSLKLAKTRVLLRGQKRTGLLKTVNQL